MSSVEDIDKILAGCPHVLGHDEVVKILLRIIVFSSSFPKSI